MTKSSVLLVNNSSSFDNFLERDWRETHNHPVKYFLQRNIVYPYHRVLQFIKDIPREVKWFIQRGKRGWSERDVWSVDSYLNKVIPEMLVELAKTTHGVPSKYMKHEKWCNLLRGQASMYYLLQVQVDNWDFKNARKTLKKIHKFMDKYYFNLWD